MRFLAYTGLRWDEMAALRVQDFDVLRYRVNVGRSVTETRGLDWEQPKTHERRSVPFSAALTEELAVLMVDKGREDLVFTDQRGGVLRNSNYRTGVSHPAVRKRQAWTCTPICSMTMLTMLQTDWTPDVRRGVDAHADADGTPVAEIVRRAVVVYLDRHPA